MFKHIEFKHFFSSKLQTAHEHTDIALKQTANEIFAKTVVNGPSTTSCLKIHTNGIFEGLCMTKHEITSIILNINTQFNKLKRDIFIADF